MTAEHITNLVIMAWGLPKERRDQIVKLINICYYSGAKSALDRSKRGDKSINDLIRECDDLMNGRNCAESELNLVVDRKILWQ